MKYVRTKDGRIIKIGEQNDVGYEKGIFEVHNKAGIVASYEPIEVLKETNTIEELCDEFDWKWNEKEFPYSKVRQHSRYGGYGDLERAMREEENYGKHLNHDYEIYGAIWTDKGLTYVAKLNKKGQWELL